MPWSFPPAHGFRMDRGGGPSSGRRYCLPEGLERQVLMRGVDAAGRKIQNRFTFWNSAALPFSATMVQPVPLATSKVK